VTTAVARASVTSRLAGFARWSVAALSGVLAAAGIVIVSAAGLWSTSAAANIPIDAAVALTYPAIGAAVLTRLPRHPVGVLLMLCGVTMSVGVLALAAVASAREPTAAARAALLVASAAWVPGLVCLLGLVPLLYPDGTLPSKRWRPVLAGVIAGGVLLTATALAVPSSLTGRVTVRREGLAPLATGLGVAAGLLLVPSVLAAVASLLVRLRTATGLRRRQIAVVLVAAALVVGLYAIRPTVHGRAGQLLEAATVTLLPLAIGVAITRHRLYDLDRVARRAMIVASLVGCLTGLYLGIFLALDTAVPDRGELVTGAAAGVTGIIIFPLASRLSHAVDRLFYGQRDEPMAALAGLSTGLRQCPDPAGIPGVVCGAIAQSLLLPWVAIEVETSAGRHLAAEAGTASGEPARFDLNHQGTRLGSLVVAPRRGERRLHPRDVELLRFLADAAAPALSAARLHSELVASRERLVVSREEERRWLRRDLHDGVGAALAAARLQLESARALTAAQTPVARLLDAAGEAVREAVGDVRRVTDDLRPPALDDLGLLGALAALADRADGPGCRVRASLPERASPLPAAVEVAAYRIAAEALNNAVRHSGARSCDLTMTLTTSELWLTVTDSGRGLPTGAQDGEGIGLRSLAERAAEIGGHCTLDSDATGTRVTVCLPTELA